MPAKSQAQQKAASKGLYKSMSEDELEELAATDRKDLPEKKSDD
jgi:hypothetical protein